MSDKERQELESQLRRQVESYNESPHPDLDGLSPRQMMAINNGLFREGCPVQWREEVPEAQLRKVPMLSLMVHLLETVSNGPVKLTTKGNLPRKLVLELYDLQVLPSGHVESGLVKLRSEEDWTPTIFLKFMALELRWVKKLKGKMSITRTGEKIMAGSRLEMLRAMFNFHRTELDLGFADGIEDQGMLQRYFGFVLHQLLRHGKEWRPAKEYIADYRRAYPTIIESFAQGYFGRANNYASAYTWRFLDGILQDYGLIRMKGKGEILQETRDAMATDLFRALFYLAPSSPARN